MFIRQVKNNTIDCNLVFSLSNDPVVRNNSFNQEKIEYTAHCNWFSKTFSDNNTLFLLVFKDKSETEFVGQIRFKRESESSIECVISLSITDDFRGKHISCDFIELGIKELKKHWNNINIIIAEVKDENTASNRLFQKYGFSLFSKVNTYKLNL